ncbi:hypothetical protein HK100_007483 [Physocladia obscura]|uniref:Tyrosinase copper-binding domain-containing protein n=1 Tax=Physocladia obscura TaxID=109957 RepID=A0AAD5T4N1_9FUNG|nr:hypothetical protein HK100_007483 [Physocladia obscura]
MKLTGGIIALFVSLVVATAIDAAQCTNPVTRREWLELTATEKGQYTEALMLLKNRPISGQTRDPTIMSYDDFVQTHVENAVWTHGNAQFYPYHRALMHQFDLAIASTGWTGGVIYWDWPSVSQNWRDSDVFDYFGAPNSTDVDNCVVTGPFSKPNFTIAPGLTQFTRPIAEGGDRTCLRRCGQDVVLTDSTIIISALMNATTYIKFRGDDTSNYHAIGHTVLGVHHGLVDKVWWRWQQLCPEFKTDYEGTLIDVSDPVSDGVNSTAYASLQLDSFEWWKISDFLETESDLLCYNYSKSAGDLPLSLLPGLTCPSAKIVPEVESPIFLENWMQDAIGGLLNQANPVNISKRDLPSSSYSVTKNIDGTLTVNYPDGKKIFIPSKFKIHRVFESNIQAISLTNGKPKMFHEQKSVVLYQEPFCAVKPDPKNHCFLKNPPRLTEKIATGMNLDWNHVQSSDNISAMKVFEHNCKCSTQ